MPLVTVYTRETANYTRVFAKDLQLVMTDCSAVARMRRKLVVCV